MITRQNQSYSAFKKQIEERRKFRQQENIEDFKPYHNQATQSVGTQIVNRQPQDDKRTLTDLSNKLNNLNNKQERSKQPQIKKSQALKYKYDLKDIKDIDETKQYDNGAKNCQREINQENVQQPLSLKNNIQTNKFSSISITDQQKRRQIIKKQWNSKTAQSSQHDPTDNQQRFIIFKQKVSQVNNFIEKGLQNVQKMLKNLKNKKNQASMKKKSNQMIVESKIQSMQITYNQLQTPIAIQDKSSPRQSRLIEDVPFIENSHVLLNGDYGSKVNIFPPQYTSFINRMAMQIQLDIQFTAIVNNLTKNRLMEHIKKIILNEISKNKIQQFEINPSFFQIQNTQLDPLEISQVFVPKHVEEQILQQEAFKLYKKYRQIEIHYFTKLFKKIDQQTINLLFQQLSQFNSSSKSNFDSHNITIGHLLSYLNMRTNNSFRNRGFVKFSKRLGLKMNGSINRSSFSPLLRY